MDNIIASGDKLFNLAFKRLGLKDGKSKIEKIDIKQIEDILECVEFPKMSEADFPRISMEQIKRKTKSTMTSLFRGAKFKVKFFDNNGEPKIMNLYQIMNGRIPSEDAFIKQILDAYQKGSKEVSVFDVDVKYETKDDFMQGRVIKGPQVVIGNPEKFLDRAPVYTEGIVVGTDRANLISAGVYGHEITHILLDRHRGVVENYYNDELLSIFMEKLIVDKLDNTPDKKYLKYVELYRMGYIKKIIKGIDKLSKSCVEYKEKMKYIQSSLYAGVLFDKYSKADEREKEKIIEQIKAVLNGTKTLNSLIESQRLSIEGVELQEYLNKILCFAEDIGCKRKDDMDFEKSSMSDEKSQAEAIKISRKILNELEQDSEKKKI